MDRHSCKIPLLTFSICLDSFFSFCMECHTSLHLQHSFHGHLKGCLRWLRCLDNRYSLSASIQCAELFCLQEKITKEHGNPLLHALNEQQGQNGSYAFKGVTTFSIFICRVSLHIFLHICVGGEGGGISISVVLNGQECQKQWCQRMWGAFCVLLHTSPSQTNWFAKVQGWQLGPLCIRNAPSDTMKKVEEGERKEGKKSPLAGRDTQQDSGNWPVQSPQCEPPLQEPPHPQGPSHPPLLAPRLVWKVSSCLGKKSRDPLLY